MLCPIMLGIVLVYFLYLWIFCVTVNLYGYKLLNFPYLGLSYIISLENGVHTQLYLSVLDKLLIWLTPEKLLVLNMKNMYDTFIVCLLTEATQPWHLSEVVCGMYILFQWEQFISYVIFSSLFVLSTNFLKIWSCFLFLCSMPKKIFYCQTFALWRVIQGPNFLQFSKKQRLPNTWAAGLEKWARWIGLLNHYH